MEAKDFTITFGANQYPAHYITDYVVARDAITKLEDTTGVLGIDTETAPMPQYAHIYQAGLYPHYSTIRLLQVFDSKESYVFDLHALAKQKDNLPGLFVPFLSNHRFIAHNALFDYQFLLNFGVYQMDIGCTLIAAKLIQHAVYPTDEGLGAGLDVLVKQILKIDISKQVQASDWGVPDLTFEQIEYAALDPICCYLLAEKLALGIKKYGLQKIYNISKAAQYSIATMELNGIALDVPKLRDMIASWKTELIKAKKEVLKLTGLESLTAHKLGEWLVQNLPPGVAAVWPRTETGKFSTDSNTFAEFSHLEVVKPFSEYQKLEKLCTSFGNRLITQVSQATGRLHPRYKICGARTGRLSCSAPNCQQMPRDPEFRKNFIAAKDNVFVVADFSQIELRIAAEVSKDPAMLKAYKEGIDIHALTASRIVKKPIAEVTKTERQLGKALSLGLLYGLGPEKFVHYIKKGYGISISTNEAAEAVEDWRSLYCKFREWQTEQANKCNLSLKVVTPSGKVRKLNEDNCYGAGLNTPIQGAAAEIMLLSLTRVQRALDEQHTCVLAKLIASVHDEIIVECCELHKLEVAQLVEHQMTRAYLDVFPNAETTLNLVEAHYGANWAEAKK